jgi:hypothetical protein
MHAAVFAAAFAVLYAAHQVADHWIQTDAQASGKGRPGWTGRMACSRHIATMTVLKAAALAVTVAVLGMPVSPFLAAAGLAIDAASHYWADRRTTLAKLASRTGKSRFYTLGAPRPGHDDNPSLGTGAYALDQSWHIAWLWFAALIIAA